jgi:hypothetical protein
VRRMVLILMLADAALFLFGAAQHAGIGIGPFSEPVIPPASIVETLCALSLIGGGVAVWTGSRRAWAAALAGNLVAIAGVIIGMVALDMGAGPRTASNDVYHRIMLTLGFAAIVILLMPSGRAALRR